MFLNNKSIFFFVLSVTVLLYVKLHVLTASWVFEDDRWYNGLNEVYNRGFNFHFIRSIPNNDLTLLTFWRNTPRAAHEINLIIHVVNALLLVKLVNLWDAPGYLVGSLFVSNPVASQAISYAGGRGELLSLTTILITLLLLENYKYKGVGVMIALSLVIKPFLILIILPILYWRMISLV